MPPSETDRNVALRCLASSIRSQREAHGLTQEQVATQAGVSRPLYVGIELGNRPLPIHRAADFGDSVVIGAVKYLLAQLKDTRLQLVNASESRLCAQSMSTLAELIRKSGEVCAVMAAALADGAVDDRELDQMEDSLSRLDEVVHKTRCDIAVLKEVRKRDKTQIGIASTRPVSGLHAKSKVG